LQKRKIILITLLISISLTGLIGIQLYWINSAIELKEQEFQNNVYAAMQNVVSKLERVEALNQLQKYKKNAPFYPHADSLNRFINSQTEAVVKEFDKFFDHSGKKVYNLKTADSLSSLEISSQVKEVIKSNHSNITIEITTDSLQKKPDFITSYQKNMDSINSQINQWIRKSNLVHDIVREIASMNMSSHIEERIDQNILDTLLKEELREHHVNTPFEYNIYDPFKQRLVLSNANLYHPGDLLNTPYRIDLFPNDIFKKPAYLLIHFPQKKQFVLGEMWLLMAISTVVVLIIILSFLFIVLALVKQKKLSNMKNDFINNMTHELKTPIATISLACEALEDKGVAKNQNMVDNYISIIDQENKRLAKLVENVLQTTVIEKGEFNLYYRDIDLHALIKEVIKNMQVQVQKKKGVITTKLEAMTEIIQGDKFHLVNVLSNLIDNAIKYSSEQLLIEIETRNYAEGIILSVRDNGIGMSKEIQKKIFDKFYRATSGNVHDVKGFGLGLSYVKAIIEMHGGKIELESAAGAGSKFEIYLPYINQQTNLNS
jgi:two-component system phosphate regulon sensor histidine kinase PhoR